MKEQLFFDGDPFDRPEWKEAELMAGAPPRPAEGYAICNLAWLARVLPLVHSAEQLVVLQLVYRRCLLVRSRTVALPNEDLQAVGMSRFGKYRAIAALEAAGLVVKEPWNGKTIQVTLMDFP